MGATLYGTNATKRNQAIPQLIPQGEAGGRVLLAYDEYTLTADLSATDAIKMMKLPAGARVLRATMYTSDLDGSGGTLDVGWEANGVDSAEAAGFISNADVTSAGIFEMAAAAAGLFKKFGAETQVVVTVDGDTDATSGTIKLAVEYVID